MYIDAPNVLTKSELKYFFFLRRYVVLVNVLKFSILKTYVTQIH
jgi:hypothetical protein